MLFVCGPYASGKRSYVRSLGYSDAAMSDEIGSDAPVLVDLEQALRAGDLSPEDFECVLSKDVVIMCEVGGGITPLDPEDRAWRDRVGRCAQELARRADRVCRLVCGIPICLKEES